jgi:hypothetical protein
MVTLDFEKVKQTVVDNGANIAQLEDNGFVLTDGMLCEYHTLVILMHMQYVYCDDLTDKQAENVSEMYNRLIVQS